MSGSAEFNFDEFLDFAQKFNKTLQEENFILDVMSRLGNMAISELKANTPVGQYDNTVFFTAVGAGGRFIASFEGPGTTKQGGTLRRNWEIGDIRKEGDTYIVEMINNTEYGSWVNNGHRKSDHSGWIEGQFFVELAFDDIKAQLPQIVGPLYEDYLRGFGFD